MGCITDTACFLHMIFFYQILYKSRCDNRLNEITERTSADKKEVAFNHTDSHMHFLVNDLNEESCIIG